MTKRNSSSTNGKENEIDKLKVLITLLQTLNGDELINGSEKPSVQT